MSKYETTPRFATTVDLILAFQRARARIHGDDDRIKIEAAGDGLFRVSTPDGSKSATFRREAIEKSIDSLNAQADKAERKS